MISVADGRPSRDHEVVRWAISAGLLVAVAYVVGLVAALRADNNEATIALIAVGGPVVGAAAGVVGALVGSKTQAAAAKEAAELAARTQTEIKSLEVDSAGALKRLEIQATADQLRLEARFRWADRLYTDVREFLEKAGSYAQQAFVLHMDGREMDLSDRQQKLQEVDMLRDMVGLNPLVQSNQELSQQVIDTGQAVIRSIMWPGQGPQKGETPTGIQLNNLARAVGAQVLRSTGSEGATKPSGRLDNARAAGTTPGDVQ